MPEIMFVLKAFIASVVITVCMQVKIGNVSMEAHAHNWLQTSSLPIYLQKVSEGAVLVIKNAGGTASEFVTKTFGKDPQTQRAARLN